MQTVGIGSHADQALAAADICVDLPRKVYKCCLIVLKERLSKMSKLVLRNRARFPEAV